jgi:hypothetical protein
MREIILDREDVEAVAGQRDFDVSPPNKWLRRLSLAAKLVTGVAVLVFIESILSSKLHINHTIQELIKALIVAGCIVILIAENGLKRGLREARQKFVDHWAKTGEIKPRWECRLKKNEELYKPPRGPNSSEPTGTV